MRANAVPHRRNRILVDTPPLEPPTTKPAVPDTDAPFGGQTTMDADLDMIVTATQIRIDSLSGLMRFLRSVRHVRAQLTDVDGLLFARFRGTRTVTGWRDEHAMRAFRNSGAHLDAMRSLGKIGRAKSATWQAREAPDWSTARSRLDAVKFRP